MNSNNNKKTQSKSNKSNKPGNGKRLDRKPRSRSNNGNSTKSISNDFISHAMKVDVPYTQSGSKVDNDPNWYKKVPAIAENAARIPFRTQVGAMLNLNNGKSITGAANYMLYNSYMSLPGAMVLDTMPTIGRAQDNTDPINVASTVIYADMRAKVKGNVLNYDKTDVLMYIMAADSAFMLYEFLIRAFRTMSITNWASKYVPHKLLEIQGFAPSLYKNYLDFKGILDTFCYQLAALCVPNVMDIMKRHSWMYTNVFTDSNDPTKAQLYLFKPTGLYVWDEVSGGSTGSTKLVYTTMDQLFNHTSGEYLVSSIDNIQHAIDKVLQPLLGSSDVGGINADLKMTYDGNLITVTPPSEKDTLQLAYSDEVLNQISNAIIYSGDPIRVDDNDLDIIQNLDNMITGPYITQKIKLTCSNGKKSIPNYSMMHACMNHLFNSHSVNPTTDELLTGTRLMALCKPQVSTMPSTDGYVLEMSSYGSEIVTRASIYQLETNKEGVVSRMHVHPFTQLPAQPIFDGLGSANTSLLREIAGSVMDMASTLCLGNSFYHMPTVYPVKMIWESSTPSTQLIINQPSQEWENVATLTPDDIENLNSACIISLFVVNGQRTNGV